MSAIPASRTIAVRSQSKRRAKSRSRVMADVVGGLFLFSVVAFSTYLASSMVG